MKVLEKLKFDKEGLIPAIVQDVENNQVLMLAYMNKEAVQKTLETGKTHFWSRSRKKLWLKGESSGHCQIVKEIFYDCDGDTILIKVEQKVAACHIGYRSCFFQKINNKTGEITIIGKKMFEEKDVYGK